MSPDQALIGRWTDAAPFWEKHRETIRQMFAPVTRALVEEVSGRQAVLDVATGPGEPALSIAATAGTGKVVGIDPVPQMVAAARRAADRLGLRNAQFEVAFADRLPFPEDSFDAAVSRFGAMFFPSPLDAVGEILRVLKPGGKLAFAVWGTAESNPFFSVLSTVLERYVDSPPPAPDAPDTFRFAESGKLRKVLMEAGVAGPAERLLKFEIQATLSAEEFWNLRVEMSEKLREKIAMLPARQLPEAKHQSLEALRGYCGGSGVRFPGEVLIVSGTKAVNPPPL